MIREGKYDKFGVDNEVRWGREIRSGFRGILSGSLILFFFMK